MPLLFRMLAVAGAAAFAGVMLAIGVILGGYWQSLPPADFPEVFARHAELIKRVIPMVVLPTLVGLAGALRVDWKVSAARGLWLAAGVCILVVLGLTMAYFVPSNTAFAARAIAVDQVPARLDTWLSLHNLRIALALAASALGIVAIHRAADRGV